MHSSVKPVLIGMLTPSSNTVLEPFTSAMAWSLFPAVSVHFSRFRVKRIALDTDSKKQFALEPILQAAELLADARVDVIAWNGTSASWLGFHTDERLCAAITQRTGIPSTSAILSLNLLLKELRIKRLGLVTPYTEDVQRKIIDNYEKIGINIVAERHGGRSDNFSFAEVTESEIVAMCREVAREKLDAIAILCTNMRGSMIAARVEEELDTTVLDSVAFTLWGCLRKTSVNMEPLAKFGRIFAKNGKGTINL